MNIFLNRSTGFSLVELAIGLAVVTVLILTVSFSSGIRDNARVQSAANSVQSLRSVAESYISSGKLDYSGMTFEILRTSKLLPAKFSETGSNPFGGNYSLSANKTDKTRFDIALTSVGTTEATKLTSYFKNVANNTSYDSGTSTWMVTF